MKHVISLLIGAVIGIGAGWYFGYTRPTARDQRELLEQYQYVRDNFEMTDAEMAEAGAKMPQYFEDMKRQDEMAAVVALRGVYMLEEGNLEGATKFLVGKVGSYYRLYRDDGGDTNLVTNIEKAAKKYPVIATEISRKDE